MLHKKAVRTMLLVVVGKIAFFIMFNILGKRIVTKMNTNNQKVTIDTSKLPKGVYFVKTKIKNQLITKRLILK